MPKQPDTPELRATEPDSKNRDLSERVEGDTQSLWRKEVGEGHLFTDRYLVVRRLGQGGFGTVYLARDQQLEREVAIKRHRGVHRRDVELLRTEAKRIASMDHPNIVSVYDLIDDPTDGWLIVMQFVAGRTLAEHLRERRPSNKFLSLILEQISRALSHAHARDIIHRDIKPSNILIGVDGRAYLTDFGLAIDRSEFFDSSVCGTPGYMAPEQIRGESHRIDRRTDLFSLGVLIYEMFVGALPFTGLTRREVLDSTLQNEPLSPRQLSPNISLEFERVILRSLRKKMSERFACIDDLMDELVACPEFRDDSPGETVGAVRKDSSAEHPSSLHHSDADIPFLVPKGFRAFDEHDANYFLQLLPGPRDRFGVPDSIRFWKSWTEGKNLETSSAIGVLYGPSGSGKTSFIRAGFVPRLDTSIGVIHVECRPGNLVERMTAAIAKGCSIPVQSLRLSQLLSKIRHDESGPTSYRKLLIVLDQFESWSHSAPVEERRELADALRQCDGMHIQTLIAVRDDFWMGITELMNWLDIPLIEGKNCASIDLLDRRLAERILEAIGRAYGSLPALPKSLSSDQTSFVRSAIGQLAIDERVICVHLTMFANMMRLQQWDPAVLKKYGGVQGACVKYLQETFESRVASPNYRRISLAVVDILELMLPAIHEEVRTKSCSRQTLEDALGTNKREKLLEESIRILSDELRLITPVGDEDHPDSDEHANPRYQLAHDFLIAPVRQWIEPIRKSTWRGRAVSRLKELSDLWSRRQTRQFYPTMVELMAMRACVHQQSASDIQRRYLRAATRFHAGRASLVALSLLLAGVLGGLAWQQSREASAANAQRLISKMDLYLHGPVEEVPRLIEELKSAREFGAFDLSIWDHSDNPSRNARLQLMRSIREKSIDSEWMSELPIADSRLFESYLQAAKNSDGGLEILAQAVLADEMDPVAIRSAILLLYLGDEKPFLQLVERSTTPPKVNQLIEQAVQWKGAPETWLPLLSRERTDTLRYLVLGILGSYPTAEVARLDQTNIDEMLRSSQPQLHSAALWWKRRHLPFDREWDEVRPDNLERWHRSPLGFSLIRVDAGKAAMTPLVDASVQVEKAEVKSSLWVTQFPVTRKHFLQAWSETPPEGELKIYGQDYLAPSLSNTSDDERKLQNNLNLGVIAEYANWLSRKEGLDPVYEFDHIEEVETMLNIEVKLPAFRLNLEKNGYRLLLPEEYCYLLSEGQELQQNWLKSKRIEFPSGVPSPQQRAQVASMEMFPNQFGIYIQNTEGQHFVDRSGSIGIDFYVTNEQLRCNLCPPGLPGFNQFVFLCRRAD